MERNISLDRLKGYACFLVVFGHVIRGAKTAGISYPSFFADLESFIWSFHVALFLFLSGCAYKISSDNKKARSPKKFILYKAINLGIPYLFFSGLYIVINSLTGSVNTHSSLNEILFLWKTPVAQYWYLYALFFLLCIWALLSESLSNAEITVLTVVFTYTAPFFGVDFGSFGIVFYSALAFGLGTVFGIKPLKKTKPFFAAAVIVIHIALGFLLVCFSLNEKSFIKEFLMLLGIYASILFVYAAEKMRFMACFFDFMSKYSFQIYLLHTIFTSAARILLLKAGITALVIHIVIGCLFGIIFSYAAAAIAKRSKVLNLVFFPTKTFSLIKNKDKAI